MSLLKRAKFGAKAYEGLAGELPNPFPRIMGPNALKYVTEVIESGLTVDMISRFENRLSEMLNVNYCVATAGCTPALAIVADTLNFEPGDEIIFSPITDYGTLMGFIKADYIPVFADTEKDSVSICAETIEPCITDRTRAIVCVHKTGIICDMDPIMKLAEKHGLIVIEDACQAFLGKYKGRYAGTIGHIGAFSFDAEKSVGSDIGGAMITNDEKTAERARFIGHSRGAVAKPGYGRWHTEPGNALRMPNCTAAVTIAEIEIAEKDNIAVRDKAARLITDLLSEIPGITPLAIPDYLDVYSCWMLGFSLDIEQFKCTVDEFGQQISDAGIPGAGTAKYYLVPESCTFLEKNAKEKIYPYSMPPASREYKYGAEVCPNAENFLETWIRWATICEKYTDEHCYLAADIIKQVAGKNRL